MFRLLTRNLIIPMTCFFIILGSHLFILEPANAVIRQQQEAPGQMLYQSRHTLRDESGKSWQVVLFKRVKDDQINTVDLRLVGFPNQAVFLHPQNLEIITAQGKLLQAEEEREQRRMHAALQGK